MDKLRRKKKTVFKSYKWKHVRPMVTIAPGLSGVFTDTLPRDHWTKLRESFIRMNKTHEDVYDKLIPIKNN